jgi:hypothetical protein
VNCYFYFYLGSYYTISPFVCNAMQCNAMPTEWTSWASAIKGTRMWIGFFTKALMKVSPLVSREVPGSDRIETN